MLQGRRDEATAPRYRARQRQRQQREDNGEKTKMFKLWTDVLRAGKGVHVRDIKKETRQIKCEQLGQTQPSQ